MDISSSLAADSCARASPFLRSFCRLFKITSITSDTMSDVPSDTPTPAPTATIFEVPGQDSASFSEAHIMLEAAAVVITVLVIGGSVLPLDIFGPNVIVSVTAAMALVGKPSGEVVVDRAALLLQQSVVSSPSARQQ